MDAYLFSDAWAKACRDELNASAAYREAGATWEGAVVFIREDGEAHRGVYVDLWHGECREAREIEGGDLDRAPYVIRGDEAAWSGVLGGSLDPLMALVTGKLKLVKGSLGTLAFQIKSARELVAAASRVQQRGR
jgi:putative sterol carrier protein